MELLNQAKRDAKRDKTDTLLRLETSLESSHFGKFQFNNEASKANSRIHSNFVSASVDASFKNYFYEQLAIFLFYVEHNNFDSQIAHNTQQNKSIPSIY